MGKQHNKVEKRIRRKDYLKRKQEELKLQIAAGKSGTKVKAPKKKEVSAATPAAAATKSAAPAKKAAPKKKVAAKKVAKAVEESSEG
jgi:hypothetical protein